tara:strand:- start:239 stop:490 length:252 start_codon:yes stop_codon:yes gene_type:complete
MSRLDTNTMTWEATEALLQLDRTFINTPNYLGVQYFWAYKYRHYLRDVSSSVRRRIHKKFMSAGLDVGEESEKHLEIIKGVIK